MNIIKKMAGAALLGVGVLAVSGCATGLPAKVTRYSALPIPAGQSFYVIPEQGVRGGLEFGRYATIVARQLEARGYRPAGTPQNADMVVRLGYGVDEGKTRYESDPFARSPFYGYGGGFYGRPHYSRYGYWGARSPYYYGWHDPFYGSPFGDRIRAYTVYQSELDMTIVRRADNAPLFEGRAQARSQSDELGVLVPNLIEAMFSGFPGRSGETVRITVPTRRS